MPDQNTIIDACSLINLYASGAFEAILKNLPEKFFVVEQVQAESLFVKKLDEATGGFVREAIDLSELFQSGLLNLVKLESDEEKMLFIQLAAALDDGEAATLAIALNRQMSFVTDDQKAIRIFHQQDASIAHLTTLDLLKEWMETQNIAVPDSKMILKNILHFANYRPGRQHHLFGWWSKMISM